MWCTFPVKSQVIVHVLLRAAGKVPTAAEVVQQLDSALTETMQQANLNNPCIDLKLCQPLLMHQPGGHQACLAPILKAMQHAHPFA
jgi:hypothetical protein